MTKPEAATQPDLDDLLYAFDQCWQSDESPHIEQFLTKTFGASTVPVKWLIELLLIDLEYRWRRSVGSNMQEAENIIGDTLPIQPLVEDYAEQFPQLNSSDLLLALIRQEYRVRLLWGDCPTHESYTRRFPELTGEIVNQLRAVESELDAENPDPAERSTTTSSADRTLFGRLGRRSEVAALSGDFGRYEIIRELGCGAMGEVYLAFDTELERHVALKTPRLNLETDKDVVERFRREARAMAQLHHPNLCPVFDVGGIDGRLYLTMAYVEGEPLTARIARNELLAADEIARLIRGIAAALGETHRNGVVHRDLKPGNVLINHHGQPIVTDFGLAYQSGSAESRLTATGTMVGTPAYMSPEQIENRIGEVGPSSDVYSLGVIFYELLAGQLPFQGSILSVLRQIAHDEPNAPSEVRSGIDGGLENVCLKMIAKNPSDRYQSMQDVVNAIDNSHVFGVAREIMSKPVERVDVKQTAKLSKSRFLAISLCTLPLLFLFLHFRRVYL